MACLWGALAGCTVGGGADLPDATTATGATSSLPAPPVDASSSPADASTAEADKDWRQAAREMRWDKAYELLQALPEADRERAEIRLALGRIALMAGHHADAVRALDGLDKQLPSVRDEIRRWYAEAAAVAGPYDVAAKTLAASPRVLDLLAAAQAWERAGDASQARKLADKAVARAQRVRRRADEAEAHLVRAGIADEAGDKAVAAADYRWFAKERPGDARARDAVAAIDRLGGVLTVDERISALAESATVANVDATLLSLEQLGQAHPQQRVALALGRARALYVARDYPRAKVAYDAAAALPSGFAAEAAYHAARSAERSDQEADALLRYAAVSSRYPSNPWAERATFRRAELLLTTGRFADAAQAFATYLSRFGKTKSTAAARYGHALALLSSGKAKDARKLFAALREDADRRRTEASMRHLEGLAAFRAGDAEGAKKLWLALVAEQPLTWPAMAAHARLSASGHKPMPPLMAEPKPAHHSPLPITLPAGPALLESLGLDDSAEQRLEQMEQSLAQGYPGRESEALCEVYGMLASARRRQKVAVRAVSLEVLMRPPTAAERWAWRCIYSRPWSDVVQREEQRYDLPAGLVHAVMRQESAFSTEALSPVGARGLMQLMPQTAARAASEIQLTFDPEHVQRPGVNVRLGAFYLSKLLRGFDGNPAVAAAAYNAGPHAVKRWLETKEERELDLWVARIPYGETRAYVQRVMGNYYRYQWLAGGTAAVTPLSLALPDTVDIGEDAY